MAAPAVVVTLVDILPQKDTTEAKVRKVILQDLRAAVAVLVLAVQTAAVVTTAVPAVAVSYLMGIIMAAAAVAV
jgi:hypothetical protein